MPLFGGGQTAQIIMQGVQLLNNTLQQANALAAEREQQDRAYKLKSEELDIHRRKLEAESKFNDLDRQIKEMQARKAQSEADISSKKLASFDDRQKLEQEKLTLENQLKTAELSDKKTADPEHAARKKRLEELTLTLKEDAVRQNTFKSQQLQIRSEDPIPLNRRFENIHELSLHRETLKRRLTEPYITDADAAEVRQELQGVDNSLMFRIEKAGKDYGLSRDEAVRQPFPTEPPTKESTQATLTVKDAQASPAGVDIAGLMKSTTAKTEEGTIARKKIKDLFLDRRATGGDAIATFMNQLYSTAPGSTDKEKADYVRKIIFAE